MYDEPVNFHFGLNEPPNRTLFKLRFFYKISQIGKRKNICMLFGSFLFALAVGSVHFFSQELNNFVGFSSR